MEDSISFNPTMCGARVSPECMALIHRGEVHREQDLEWVGTIPGDTNRRGDIVKVLGGWPFVLWVRKCWKTYSRHHEGRYLDLAVAKIDQFVGGLPDTAEVPR